MKKTLAVVGAIALAGVLGVTAAGCSNKSRNLASLSSNWYYDTGFKRIQPTFTEENAEKLTYTVFQAEDGNNATYEVKHETGTYTTEFYAKKMTETELAEITLEDWRTDYTKALGNSGYMYLYYYKTELKIPSITFTLKNSNEEPKVFEDQSVITESYFLSVEDYLRPVYSVRTINRAIPWNLQATSLDDCFYEVDTVYESFYNLSGSSVQTKITDNNADEKESTYSLGGLTSNKNSVFDVAYLDVAVRAMRNISSGVSQTVGIYTPGLPVRDYAVTSVSKAVFEGENAETEYVILESKLKDKGLFTSKPVDEEDPDKGFTRMQTAAISITYNGGSFSGVSQTYWFAVDSTANETRTLMIKYSEPLTYNLGRLDYVLDKIENVNI